MLQRSSTIIWFYTIFKISDSRLDVIETSRDPCSPSPCGPNALCKTDGENASCACLNNYKGTPPNCRPECSIHADCNSNEACINEKCRDPCPGSCGLNAQCNVVNHIPNCACLEGYTGDPFSSCYPKPLPEREYQSKVTFFT